MHQPGVQDSAADTHPQSLRDAPRRQILGPDEREDLRRRGVREAEVQAGARGLGGITLPPGVRREVIAELEMDLAAEAADVLVSDPARPPTEVAATIRAALQP